MVTRTRDSERKTDPEMKCVKRGGKSREEGVILGRIWLVLGSLRGELHCNPLLSMQTWAEFHKIPQVAANHWGYTGVCVFLFTDLRELFASLI